MPRFPKRSSPRWAESGAQAAEAIRRAERILLCLRFGIGDLVLELPVVRALRRAAPEARIVALGARPALELLEPEPSVDEVVALQDLGFRHAGARGIPIARWRFSRWLDRSRFDVVLDSEHAPLGVRRGLARRPELRAEGVPWEERDALRRGEGAARAIAAGVEEGWGIPVSDPVPKLATSAADGAWADRFVAALPGSGRAPLALFPVASSALKRWPLERYLEAARRAVEAAPRPVLVFVGPDDALGRQARDLAPDLPLAVYGVERLHRTAAVLARCAAAAGNDTGLLHVAAAVGVPVVGIFGPTDPDVYLPRGVRSRAVGGTGIDCRHRHPGEMVPPECWSSDRCLLGGESCVRRAEVPEVAAAIRALLDDDEARPAPARRLLR